MGNASGSFRAAGVLLPGEAPEVTQHCTQNLVLSGLFAPPPADGSQSGPLHAPC